MNIPEERKKELLKQVIWDYNVSPDLLLDILENKLKKYSHINRKYLINRCFNYLNWYQFVSLFDKNDLLNVLQEINVDSRKTGKKTIIGLEFAKRFLRKETLSASG
jgi:hypothetical protein